MREMRRLREETKSHFARALLESADADRSATGACERALGTLGLGAAGAAVVKGAAALGGAGASAAATGGGMLPSAPASAKVSALFFLKWVGIGALGGAVTIGTAALVQEVVTPPAERVPLSAPASSVARARPSTPSLDPGHAPPSAPGTAAPLSPSIRSEVTASTHEATRSIPFATPAADAPPPPGETTPERASVAAGLAPTPSEPIAAQLRALGAIRATLAAKDPARALSLLDEFETHNPQSSLFEEVTVLRVDALMDAGRQSEAAVLAGAFLQAHPASAYGEHIRSKLKSP